MGIKGIFSGGDLPHNLGVIGGSFYGGIGALNLWGTRGIKNVGIGRNPRSYLT